ncbi:MAG TPA: hypothetical protein PKE49_17415, partial [Leptospiraceae bacterium]|nr:hypothetical protein [Leptospiraceae bacterium]
MGYRRSPSQSQSRSCALILFILSIFFAASRVEAVPHADWSDLEAPEAARVYGSEKEEKYPTNLFFIEREAWEGHHSWHAFWFAGQKDYPTFSSTRFIPFYYHLWSKGDNRERTWIAPPFYFNQIDNDTSLTVTPLTLFDDSESRYLHMYGWFYMRRKESDVTHTAVIPFVLTGNGPGTFYATVIPFFYYRSNESPEQKSSALFTPLYAHWSASGKENSFFSISPLHFYNRSESSTSTGFPVIPMLMYRSVSGDTVHSNYLSIIDMETKENAGLRRLLVLPLFYHYADDITWFIPFYFKGRDYSLIGPVWRSKSGEDETSLHVFPLFLSGGTKDTAYSYSLLHFYSRDAAGTAFGFPILPFLMYRNSENGTVHSNYLSLFDMETNEKTGLRRLVVLPLFYHFADDFTWFIPFYFSGKDYSLIGPVWRSNSGAEDSNLHVFPFFFSGTSKESAYSYSPFHFYSRSGTDTAWGFPILPILAYKNQEGDRVHRNLLSFIDWSTNAKGLERLWVLPLYFQGSDYLVAAPFYFSWEDGSTKRKNVLGFLDWRSGTQGLERLWVLPFVYYWPNDALWVLPVFYRGSDYLAVAPFYFHTEDKVAKSSTSFGPVYYWYDSEKEHQRLIGNVWWSSNGPSSSLIVAPVYFSWFEKPDPKGLAYSKEVYNPLFANVATYSSGESLEFEDTFWAPIIPLYFHKATQDVDYRWALLASWSFDRTYGDLHHLAIAPFYFWKAGKKSGYLVAAPFFIRPNGPESPQGVSFGITHYHSWTETSDFLVWGPYYHDYTPEAQYKHVLPVYWSWHTQQSTGQILFPLFVDYEDKTKSAHVNLSGYSSTKQAGIVGSSVGTKDGRYYLDTEVSWLYNAFSISARISTPALDSKKDTKKEDSRKPVGDVAIREPTLRDVSTPTLREMADQEQKDTKKAPHLAKTVNAGKEDSYYYWGVTVLYGLLSYQHADSMRHFRMLPFYWFSWDTNSNDKVYVVPGLFLNYASADLEYFAIFPGFLPVYGRQRQGKSWVEAYGAFLAIREHDEEEKRDELSVLWPLANFHKSEKSEGSRVIPVYWHRVDREKEKTIERTVSLAYFRTVETTAKAGATKYTSEDAFTMAPIVPLFFRWSATGERKQETTTVLLPFFYLNSISDGEGEKKTTESSFFSLPGIYYHGRHFANFEESTLFVLGYYSHSDSRENSTSVLFGLYSNEKYPGGGYYTKYLYGLVTSYEKSDGKAFWILPFYYSNQSLDGKETHWNVLGLINRTTDELSANLLVAPLFYTRYGSADCEGKQRRTWAPFTYYQNTECGAARNSFTMLMFPFFYYDTDESHAAKSDSAEVYFASLPGIYYHTSRTGEMREKTLFVLGYYSHSNSDEDNSSILLGLYSNETLKGGSRSTSFLYGLASFYSSPEESGSRILPFYTFNQSANGKQTHWNVLGFVNRSVDETSSNLLVAPFFYTSYGSPGCEGGKQRQVWAILGYYDDTDCGATQKSYSLYTPLYFGSANQSEQYSSSWWFLPVPFLYRSSRADSTEKTQSFHTNLALLEDWESDEKGLRSVWSLPIV